MTRDPKNPTPSAAKFGARAALDVIIVAVAVLAVAAASALIGCGGPHGDQVSTSQGSGTSDVVVVPAKGLPASAEVASVGMDPASGSHGIGNHRSIRYRSWPAAANASTTSLPTS